MKKIFRKFGINMFSILDISEFSIILKEGKNFNEF